MSSASRRALLVGGSAASLLAACGEDTPTGQPTGGPPTETPKPAADTVLAKKSEVPVGSGKIDFADAIVVTQPAAGQFLGFSAICTHQGCVVAKIQGDTIICSCHGSEYSIKDGSVKKGPAREPLEKVAVKVEGDDIKLAS